MKYLLDLLNTVPALAVLTVSALFVVLGDFLAKSWAVGMRGTTFALAILAYVIGSALFITTLTRQNLIAAGFTWDLVELIGFLFIALIIFREPINGYTIAGTVLAIAAIVLLQKGG